jgi:hypothetical protein
MGNRPEKENLELATAPTPPVKPIPPTAPTMTPVSITTPSGQLTHSDLVTGNKVNPEVSGIAMEMERLGKDFQGTSTQPSAGDDKAALAATTQNQGTVTIKAPPIASLNTQDGTSAKTIVPPNTQIPGNQGSYSGYAGFFVVILAIAAILIGVHLFKSTRGKTHQSARTNTASDKPGMDIAIAQQRLEPKAKSSFDFRA